MKNTITIAFIIHRWLSGVMNGAFYAAIGWLVLVANLAMNMLSAWMLLRAEADGKRIKWKRFFFYAAIISTVMTFISMVHIGAPWADIHFWTLAQQGALAGGLFVSDVGLPRLLLTVAPAVFGQKLLVNIVGGNPWNYVGTDDASGLTYGLPSLGLKVPRLGNMYLRGALAALSVAALLWINHCERKQEQQPARQAAPEKKVDQV